MGELVSAVHEGRVDATGTAVSHWVRLSSFVARAVKMMAVLDQYTRRHHEERANEAISLSASAEDWLAVHTDPWPGQITAG